LIWEGLYVVVIGKLNLPEATTFVASVSADPLPSSVKTFIDSGNTGP
jgi:hypothetical protein